MRVGFLNNLYNLSINVPKLYKKFPLSWKNYKKTNPFLEVNPFCKIYKSFFIPLKYRNYFWYLFRRIGLDQSWFDEFKYYWMNVLGGRPLWGIQDFYFLRNIYRLKFRNIKLPVNSRPNNHLKTWQRSEMIYQLLHQVYKESLLNQLEILNYLNKYKKERILSFLEFGCGTAPITTSFFEFFNIPKDLKIYLADIQTISFHYASYKFRNIQNVIPILLVPENNFLLNLKKKVDIIFCIEVFEHLNQPLKIIKIFHEILNKNGLLFFDYIKGRADGLNTVQGVKERKDVLEFIIKNFKLIHGDFSKDKSIFLAIVSKK